MRNLISISVLLILSLTGISQTFTRKDSLRFAPDSSYSRAIVRFGKELIFGTSKSGAIAYHERKKTTRQILFAIPKGEYRDIVIWKNIIYGMVSGDDGMIEQNRSLKYIGRIVHQGVFYDDMSLQGDNLTILGDPVDGVFFLEQYNLHSNEKVADFKIKNQPNEACYAASGTTACFLENGDYCFISGGGNQANFHRLNWKDTTSYFKTALPMALGEGAGPFSVFFSDSLHGTIVGGTYTKPNDQSGTAVYTVDGGKTWIASTTLPAGYRSCVTGNKKIQFACGSSGIDFSTDGGKNWQQFDSGNYCALLLEKKTLYATTNKGVCIRYRIK